MVGDPSILEVVDNIVVGAALCYGPIMLIGSKRIRADVPQFASFNGCWIYIRDAFQRRETKKPGSTVWDDKHRLSTGNSPVVAKAWIQQFIQEVEKDVKEGLS